MHILGLPETFWIVIRPTPDSDLGDICFQCDFEQFACQVRGGLHEDSILGIFAREQDAVELAESVRKTVQSQENRRRV
jgi:hypothetical protein